MYQGRLQLVWIAITIVVMALATAVVVWLPYFKDKKPVRVFSIAKEFGRFPGGPEDSPYSGDAFRFFVLNMLENPGSLAIDLDNTWGYSSAFLKAAFLNLAKEIPDIHERLRFISEEDPTLVTEIWEYIDKV
jgi:hypothetical protein